MTDPTHALLTELQAIDDREDHILDVLLRHGAALEESERRLNMVTIADLRALRDGLASLEGIIDALQADVAHAEAAAAPPAPASPSNGSASNGHAQPAAASAPAPAPASAPAPPAASAPALPAASAPAPVPATPVSTPTPTTPLPSMTFEQLAARIREQDAEAAQIKEILRDRLLALGAMPADSTTPATADSGAATPAVTPQVPTTPSDPLAGPTTTPAATAHRTFRLSDPAMTGSDIKRFQRDLNRRFAAWKINIHVREDGRYGKATRQAARQALLGLGVAPEDYRRGITPQLRILLRTPSKRTALQLAQAEARRLWRQRLRKREAGSKPKQRATSSSGEKGSGAPRGGSAAAVIRAHDGRYEDEIVREAKRHGLPVALVCAVIECETHFRNVFGHDAVRNPIKSPAKGLLEVTEARYRQYLKHRRAGAGAQGVGCMQLTSPGLQDKADAVGGCWKPSANIRIGCEFLAGNIKRLGSTRQGVRAYNGSGPAAERYATKVLERERVWRQRLAKAKRTAPAQSTSKPDRRPAGAKRTPRTFKLKRPAMSGSDVKRLQRDLNARFERWKIYSRISEDGEYGPTTRHAAQQVLLGLGVAPADYARGITPRLRSKIRNPSLRTPSELARAKTRKTYLAKLRKRTSGKRGGALRLRAYAEAKRMHDLNIRESAGKNRGPMVDKIIRANHGMLGQAWCGDFMAWCYRQAGSKAVTQTWARARAVAGLGGVSKTGNPLKGNLIYFSFDHIAMFVSWCDAGGNEVEKSRATHVKSLDGNSERAGAVMVSDGAGAGGGVYVKVRPRSSVAYFMNVRT